MKWFPQLRDIRVKNYGHVFGAILCNIILIINEKLKIYDPIQTIIKCHIKNHDLTIQIPLIINMLTFMDLKS